MEEKCTYIDEIVVQTPHDAVSEFIERLRASQAVGEEDTPNNDVWTTIEPGELISKPGGLISKYLATCNCAI